MSERINRMGRITKSGINCFVVVAVKVVLIVLILVVNIEVVFVVVVGYS